MAKPIVAVVGRPNVGKSTLFNKLVGERISIVEDTPGVTRDRIYAECEWLGRQFTLIDTGGLEPDSDDIIQKQMFNQAQIAIETANVIIFVVDVKAGVLEADMEVANLLRKSKKPVVLAVNKVDNMREENLDVYEFYSLGLGEPIPISAGQALSLGDLLDEVVDGFKYMDEEEDEEDTAIKVAIVGKPNVGKSSLINRILGEDRLIVSDIAGTTRDAIDTRVTIDEQEYVFIDTAGMRRKSRIKENIEKYSIVRSIAAIERADVVVLVIDATEGITEQDTKIAGMAHEAGKPSIIVVNKWDLIEKDTNTMKEFELTLREELAYMPYAPKLFISAQTGQRVNKLFDMINAVTETASMRVQTGVLNDVLIEAMQHQQPPRDKGKALRIYYMTQVSIKPPTFVLFVNDTALLHFSYKRYIENKVREAFGFKGTPIRFVARNKNED